MRLTLLSFAVISALAIRGSERSSAQSSARVDFPRDIQPLLRANCYGCHNVTLSSGNFRLDRRRDSMPNRVGANNARIVPGKSEESRLYQRISGTQSGLQMPPTGALRPEEIRTVKAWIDRGAEWPDALAGETPSPPQDPIATQLLDAIRRRDRAAVARRRKQSPTAARDGKDQFISAAATNWATIALARAVR
jgi:Planctomycete cytochrome C